jgi:hypothetical protein
MSIKKTAAARKSIKFSKSSMGPPPVLSELKNKF